MLVSKKTFKINALTRILDVINSRFYLHLKGYWINKTKIPTPN